MEWPLLGRFVSFIPAFWKALRGGGKKVKKIYQDSSDFVDGLDGLPG
jgi:hypothetical protein